jgi:membrane protein required for beta-lactamase induction
MLIEIFNKLTRVDVLYSILGVNKWLNRLTRDPIFDNQVDNFSFFTLLMVVSRVFTVLLIILQIILVDVVSPQFH